MTSRSTQSFFAELGIAQTFSRPRTPTDNTSCESWMATLKCERLYWADPAEMVLWEMEEMIDRFMDSYNNVRLHQALQFVSPAERHEGRHIAIIAARNDGVRKARQMRKMVAYGGAGEVR
jgi:putative transposase